MLLNLSEAMRYNLYESEGDFNSLTKELVYLKNYVALNVLKMEEDATISINIDDYSGTGLIAHLVITPFIENAFKYVNKDQNKESNFIDIKIAIKDDSFDFCCENSALPFDDAREKNKGLGISNVKSRLRLLYGETYNLTIDVNEYTYVVNLKLPLINNYE